MLVSGSGGCVDGTGGSGILHPEQVATLEGFGVVSGTIGLAVVIMRNGCGVVEVVVGAGVVVVGGGGDGGGGGGGGSVVGPSL